MNRVDHLQLLESELPSLRMAAEKQGLIAFFAEEAMRFFSIAETVRRSFHLDGDDIEARNITHILGRSLLEGFF